jgi:hypothetical protein
VRSASSARGRLSIQPKANASSTTGLRRQMPLACSPLVGHQPDAAGLAVMRQQPVAQGLPAADFDSGCVFHPKQLQQVFVVRLGDGGNAG